MSTDWQDPATVDRMLDDLGTWAVVGLSGDPGRTAYSIASLLQRHALQRLGDVGADVAHLGAALEQHLGVHEAVVVGVHHREALTGVDARHEAVDRRRVDRVAAGRGHREVTGAA